MSRERFQVGQQNWGWTKGGIYKSKIRKGKKFPKQELGLDFISSAWGMTLVIHKHGDHRHTKKGRNIIGNPCEKNKQVYMAINTFIDILNKPVSSSSPLVHPLDYTLWLEQRIAKWRCQALWQHWLHSQWICIAVSSWLCLHRHPNSDILPNYWLKI